MKALALFIVSVMCLHAQNVFPGGTGTGGGGGGSPLPNAQVTFASSSTASISGQGTPYVLVACYDSSGNTIFFNQATVSQVAPYPISITFSSPQTGYCVANASGGTATASSFVTTGTNTGTLTITSKTSLAMSTISQSDTLVAGAALSVSNIDSGGTGDIVSTITDCGILDYRCESIREGFIPGSNTTNQIGAYGWDLNNIGTTGCTFASAIGYYPNQGLASLTTSSGGTSRGCVIELDGASNKTLSSNLFAAPFSSWWVANLNALTTTPQIRIGFFGASAASAKPVAGGVYFCFDASATGCGAGPDTTHWNACSNSAGTEVCASMGVTPQTYTITGATNANPIVISTASTTNLVVGTNVVITGVTGNTNANGICHITVIVPSTSFTCGNLSGNSAYVSGGVAIPFYRFSIAQAGSGIASFALYLNGTQAGSTVKICPSSCTVTATLPVNLTPGVTFANGGTAEADVAYLDAFAFLANGLIR